MAFQAKDHMTCILPNDKIKMFAIFSSIYSKKCKLHLIIVHQLQITKFENQATIIYCLSWKFVEMTWAGSLFIQQRLQCEKANFRGILIIILTKLIHSPTVTKNNDQRAVLDLS